MLKSRLESLQNVEDHFITAHLSNIILSSIILRQWIKWFMNETTYDSFLHKPLKWNNNGKLEKSLKVNKTNILQICKIDKTFKTVRSGIYISYYGVLLSKLFWRTMRKNCSSDWEFFLKFEAEGRLLANFMRSLVQFIHIVKGQNNFL